MLKLMGWRNLTKEHEANDVFTNADDSESMNIEYVSE
jgi:hypothetical protein